MRLLGCPSGSRVVYEKDDVKSLAYGPCNKRSELVFYSIDDMGHTWPGGRNRLPERLVGKSSDSINCCVSSGYRKTALSNPQYVILAWEKIHLMNTSPWRRPAVVLLCGSMVVFLALGLRTNFGLFLKPMSDKFLFITGSIPL